MNKMSKRLDQAQQQIDKTKEYDPAEAIKLAKETSKVKFDASVEVHVNLDIDPTKSDQTVRAQTTLPHGTGKTLTVAAFVTPEMEKQAKEAGADIVGGKDLIDEIKKTNKTDFDIAVAEPGIMKELAQVAKTLGQRRLMPTPKTGTVGPDIGKIIKELKEGKIDIKMDKSGNLHQIIGKVSYEDRKLFENFETYMHAVRTAKPSGAKAGFIRRVSLSTSMGPSIKVKI